LFAYSCASETLISDNQHERVETQLEIDAENGRASSTTEPSISHDDPEPQLVSVPTSAPFLPPPACDRPVDPAFVAATLNIPRRLLLFPPRIDIHHIPPPVLPKFIHPPRFAITERRLTAIKKLFERRTAPSLLPYDDEDVLMGSIPPDSLPQRQLGEHYGSNILTGVERYLHAPTIGPGQEDLRGGGSPPVSEGPWEGRRHGHGRIYSYPRNIPKLDYGLPKDFGQ
jgi:hypothetical protein